MCQSPKKRLWGAEGYLQPAGRLCWSPHPRGPAFAFSCFPSFLTPPPSFPPQPAPLAHPGPGRRRPPGGLEGRGGADVRLREDTGEIRIWRSQVAPPGQQPLLPGLRHTCADMGLASLKCMCMCVCVGVCMQMCVCTWVWVWVHLLRRKQEEGRGLGVGVQV